LNWKIEYGMEDSRILNGGKQNIELENTTQNGGQQNIE
jgi:hypothetical protein